MLQLTPYLLFLLLLGSECAKATTLEDFILGKYNYKKMDEFIEIDNSNKYLQTDTYQAFVRMRAKAKKDGVNLRIISGTRSFYQQKWIWERKWTGKKLVKINKKEQNLLRVIPNHLQRAKHILRFSSMPGTSRHHWGTDIDIYSISPADFEKPEGKKIYDWLVRNALEYGFCQPYTAGRKTGYLEEKWHWSYIPRAKIYTNYIRSNFTDKKISGFLGSRVAKELDVINKYVFGINEKCL